MRIMALIEFCLPYEYEAAKEHQASNSHKSCVLLNGEEKMAFLDFFFSH